jgi:hypothetical protein
MMALRRAVARNLMTGRNKAWPRILRNFDMIEPCATARERVRENECEMTVGFMRKDAMKTSSQY